MDSGDTLQPHPKCKGREMTMREPQQDRGDKAILLMLESQETRIAKLESEGKKTIYKRLTESASASALFLGLVLTFGSLRETFVTKPEADRISRLSQFNEIVNTAVQRRQELIKMQAESSNPKLVLDMESATTTAILNDMSTARAILRDLSDRDVGISQLTVLFNESLTAGDMESGKTFQERAVKLTGVSTFEHSEALRLEGRYFFASGDPIKGRQSYMAALSTLSPELVAAKAYDLIDLIPREIGSGDCQNAGADSSSLATMINSPQVPPQAKSQLVASLKGVLSQMPPQRCPEVSKNLDTILGKQLNP
jgi:hypothetical protein